MRPLCPARVLMIGIVWAVSLTVSRPARAGGAGDVRREALRLHAEGRYAEALPLLDQVLARKPRDIQARLKRGGIYLRTNQPARALADFDAASRYVPFFDLDEQQTYRQQVMPDVPFPLTVRPYWSGQLVPEAFSGRGLSLLMLGRPAEAAADFGHAVGLLRAQPRLGPSLVAAYCGLGQAYHNQGDDARALGAFEQAVRLAPGDPDGHAGRGEAFAGLGRYEEALAAYGSALALDPRAAAVFRLRAALLSRLGRHEPAIDDLSAAIRLSPGDAVLYKDRGGVYNRLGRHADALRDLNESLRLDPSSAKALQNRAAAYNGLARYEEAVLDGDAALRIDPKNAGAWNNRGLARGGLGQLDGAVGDLTESIRLDPRQVAAYFNRAVALARLGRYSEAGSDYEEVLRREPKLVMAEAGLVRVRELSRLRALGVRDDLALRQAPDEARQAIGSGNALRDAGDWAGAVAEFTRAIGLDPENADAYALRGWASYCAGRPGAGADARAWLDRKGWRDPFAPYMALLGVLASRREGRAADATGMLDEALANGRAGEWPAPLFRYLKRTLPSTALLAEAGSEAAGSRRWLTEAHAVVGLDLLDRGERTAAAEHLRWARDHGPDGSIARDVAAAALRHLGGPPSPSP